MLSLGAKLKKPLSNKIRENSDKQHIVQLKIHFLWQK